ncbi:expressed unknown protein [Seminavis robusta]|uniref:Uncharacterized protein n=1 Tax=Seminavis robusta TaxID=568900 RepID=A0A9N8HUE0_9STRA|nr:expressed unknown protein [Seminavis robusta]|eukprot:Sro1735_g294330.1 n/a (452) ;mRNA; f:3129-4668
MDNRKRRRDELRSSDSEEEEKQGDDRPRFAARRPDPPSFFASSDTEVEVASARACQQPPEVASAPMPSEPSLQAAQNMGMLGSAAEGFGAGFPPAPAGGLDAYSGALFQQANLQRQMGLAMLMGQGGPPDPLVMQYLASQQQQQQAGQVPLSMNMFLSRQAAQLQQRMQQPGQQQQLQQLQQLAQQQHLAAAAHQHFQLQQQAMGATAGLPVLAQLQGGGGGAPHHLQLAALRNLGGQFQASGGENSLSQATAPRVERSAAPAPIRSTPRLTGRPPITLDLDTDGNSLSPYQCLARKHMELFEALQVDVDGGAQGRNRPIVLGQVGVRCRYCTHLPLKQRLKASSYYPAKAQGLYQACQNILNGHMLKECRTFPLDVRRDLIKLQTRKSAPGGGKHFWSEAAETLGVYEDEHGLRFHPLQNTNDPPDADEERKASESDRESAEGKTGGYAE